MGETPYNPLPAPPESRAPLLQSQGSGLLLRDASKPKLTVAPGRTLKIVRNKIIEKMKMNKE